MRIRMGLATGALPRITTVRFPGYALHSLQKLCVFSGLSLSLSLSLLIATLLLTMNETFKWLLVAAHLNAEIIQVMTV